MRTPICTVTFTLATTLTTPALTAWAVELPRLATPLALSAPRGDAWWARDKALHFGASAGIAVGGYAGSALVEALVREPELGQGGRADRKLRLAIGGGLALGAGIAKELSDRYTGGDPSWRDLGWDVVGTATGLAVAYSIDWLITRRWR